MLRLELSLVARTLLPTRHAGEQVARALYERLRYGRSEQHLLPLARGKHFRIVESPDAAGLLDGGEGEPLPDPSEAPEGSGRAARAVFHASLRARHNPWPGAVSTAVKL